MANILTKRVTDTAQTAALTAISQSVSETIFDWASEQKWTQDKKTGESWLTGTVRGVTEIGVGVLLLGTAKGSMKRIGSILGTGMVVSGVYSLSADAVKGFIPLGKDEKNGGSDKAVATDNGNGNTDGFLNSYTSNGQLPHGLGSYSGASVSNNAIGSLY